MNENSKSALRLYLKLASSEEVAVLKNALEHYSPRYLGKESMDMSEAVKDYSSALYELMDIVRSEYHGMDLRPEMFFNTPELLRDG